MFDEFDDTDLHLKDDDSSSDEDAPKEMGFGKVIQTNKKHIGHNFIRFLELENHHEIG